MDPAKFIALIAPAAQNAQRTSGIPASFHIAQAALESGWGERAIGCNLFGVKADASWVGKPTTLVPTTEYVNGVRTSTIAKFRAYKTWDESFADHVVFFKKNPRYAACFKEKTGEGWARAVAAAGYATDPNYADKLIATIRARKLTQYDTNGTR